MKFRSTLVFGVFVVSMILMGAETQAQNTGYYPRVFARGIDRQIIRNTPIELRPNRPFHFYGNTVRRLYNRPAPLQSRRLFPSMAPPVFSPRRIGQRFSLTPTFRR